MPKEILVKPEAGQEVVVNPVGGLKIAKINRSKSRLQARVVVEGVYVDPEPPPVEPPPVEPPPVEPPPTGEPAFLSRPTRAPFTVQDATDVELSNFTIIGGTIALTLRRVKRAHISLVDVADCVGGIFVSECEDIIITDCRGRNIGDNTIGSGHSNYIQFAASSGGAIRRNRFLGGHTEDMISTWHSGGKSATDKLIIEDNHIEGRRTDSADVRAWTRSSGTGIILSDGGGDSRNGNIICRRNTLLTPGQVCIQIIDGPGLEVYDNIILAEQYALNNNPMTTWEGAPQGYARNNRYFMTKGDGSHPDPWKHGGGNMDFSANIEDSSLKASDLAVVL